MLRIKLGLANCKANFRPAVLSIWALLWASNQSLWVATDTPFHPNARLTCPLLAEGMIFVLATLRSYGHVVEATGNKVAEGTFADRLGNDKRLNHQVAVGEGHHIVIHVPRSRQPGDTQVVIASRIVHCDTTHTGRDCG